MFLKSPQQAPCLGRFENGSWEDCPQPRGGGGGGEQFASSLPVRMPASTLPAGCPPTSTA